MHGHVACFKLCSMGFIALGFGLDMFIHLFVVEFECCSVAMIMAKNPDMIMALTLGFCRIPLLLHDDLIDSLWSNQTLPLSTSSGYGDLSIYFLDHHHSKITLIFYWVQFPCNHIRDSNFLAWESLLWSKQSIFLPTFLRLMSASTHSQLFASTRASRKKNSYIQPCLTYNGRRTMFFLP